MICVLVYTLIFINDTPLLGSVELFFFFFNARVCASYLITAPSVPSSFVAADIVLTLTQ